MMERTQSKTKEPVIPILDDPLPSPKKTSAPEPTISVDNINGQLTELADINQMLTARCTKQRGLMADMQRQIRDQTEVIMRLTSENAELKGATVLRHGRRGRRNGAHS